MSTPTYYPYKILQKCLKHQSEELVLHTEYGCLLAGNPSNKLITKLINLIVRKREEEIERKFTRIDMYLKYDSVTSDKVDRSFSKM